MCQRCSVSEHVSISVCVRDVLFPNMSPLAFASEMCRFWRCLHYGLCQRCSVSEHDSIMGCVRDVLFSFLRSAVIMPNFTSCVLLMFDMLILCRRIVSGSFYWRRFYSFILIWWTYWWKKSNRLFCWLRISFKGTNSTPGIIYERSHVLPLVR